MGKEKAQRPEETRQKEIERVRGKKVILQNAGKAVYTIMMLTFLRCFSIVAEQVKGIGRARYF